jgi:hypothetical protein
MRSTYEETGKVQRKIDVYRKTISGAVYVCSTKWHSRCKDAAAMVGREKGIPKEELFARFAVK